MAGGRQSEVRVVTAHDEVDEALGAGRTKDGARLLLERRLEHALRVDRLGERVVRNVAKDPRVLVHALEERVEHDRLGRARAADEHDRLAQVEHHVAQEEHARRVHRGHKDVGVSVGARVRVRRDDRLPVGAALRLALLGRRVDEEVVDRALVGEAHRRLGKLGAPVAVEALAVVGALVGAEAAADAPHRGELEVGLVHLLLVAEPLSRRKAGHTRPERRHRLATRASHDELREAF